MLFYYIVAPYRLHVNYFATILLLFYKIFFIL
nr:MAG TPA: hypothetical protein [Caudoviricetes sp.]